MLLEMSKQAYVTWDGSLAPSALSQLDISRRRRRVGVGRNWVLTKKMRETSVFVGSQGDTDVRSFHAMQPQRPGSETPEVATRLPLDGSVCVSALSGDGEGGSGCFLPVLFSF